MRVGLTVALLALAACGGMERSESSPGAAARTGGVIDSVIPMDVALERFNAGVERPAGLRSSIRSRDRLIATLIDGLVKNDTSAIEAMAVDHAEFGYLYYPSARTAQPPYELPPALAWFQLQERNRRSVFRALREFGGRRLAVRATECPPEPTVEGENKIWSGCQVALIRDGKELPPITLFGAILEREGRLAFLSYNNDF